MISISTGTQIREVASEELPLALSIGVDGGLLSGEQAEATPSLWLRNHDDRYYLQPESDGHITIHNGTKIEESVWLSAGDRIEMGDCVVSVEIEDGNLTLSAAPPAEEPPTPVSPQPEKQPEELPAGPAPAAPPRTKKSRSRSKRIIVAVFAVLVLGVGFVLSASPVSVSVQPSPSSVSLNGIIPPIPFGDRYLAFPGNYTVKATLPGFRPLEESVEIEFGETYNVAFRMRKLPGLLSVKTDPSVSVEVRIDGEPAGRTPLTDAEVDPGSHRVSIASERYLPAEKSVDIVGKGERQILTFALDPAWGTVRVTTAPSGADVRLNGRLADRTTPLTAEPAQGNYELEVSKEGWKPVFRVFDILPGQTIDFGVIKLERVDGKLALTSTPSDASVTVNGAFRGRTPVELNLVSGETYGIGLTKPGYEPITLSAAIKPNETTALTAKLVPEFGVVFFRTRPSGATLKVDGRPKGPASQRLTLPTRTHRIEISKPGYLTFRGTVTPRKGQSKRLTVALKRKIDALREKSRQSVTTAAGHKVRIVPIDGAIRFNMGASRREAGRRSNETLYPVELTKSFVIGEIEVTNAEFRRFRPSHNSGTGLNGDKQPVVSVTWDDAARYLNWLSKRENLPAAYREDGKRMVAVLPLNSGYRLPTEAEWAFAARYEAGNRSASQPLKYPWGPSMPPAPRSGNFADRSAGALVPLTVPGYADGFRRTAPVGRFPANAHGIRDLGGNAAEWVNDFYDTSVGGRAIAQDPTGPKSGRFRVVRGSSWRHGSITELRLSFRDFSDSKRNDIGFRIARYVQTTN